MTSQKELILNGNWDNLIVLDACRYDYFERIYGDYLDGELKRVISAGSGTPEWLRETFGNKRFDDIVYVSANPFINSRGKVIEGFEGSDYFYKIVDVWDFGWDDKMKTVPPKYVSKRTRIAKAKHPSKDLIAHFMQPHYPYLSLGPLRGGFSGSIARARGGTGRIRWLAGRLAVRLLGRERVHKIMSIIRNDEQQVGEIEAVVQKYGKNGLRDAYMGNLKIALEKVAKLVGRLPGKSVITSDHGEFLGEDNLYGHPTGYNHPLLKKIPWLEAEKQ